jgi:hypothetical protein
MVDRLKNVKKDKKNTTKIYTHKEGGKESL